MTERAHISLKLFSWLSAGVILTYAAVLAVGFFMPLQNDEINWLIQNDRAWIDGKTLIYLFPQCGKESFIRPLPYIWYVPALLNYLTYGQIDNPLWVRIGGMLQFLVWLSLWACIAVKLFTIPRKYWWVAVALLLTFLGWDAIPLVLLVNRPEQNLLIGAGISVAMALYAEQFTTSNAKRVLGTVIMALTVMCTHVSHAKAAALLPVELAMYGVFLERIWQRRAITLLGLAAILWIAIESYLVWSARVSCPEAPEVNEFLSGLYLPIETLWQAPTQFFHTLAKNALASLTTDFYLDVYFHTSPVWIPLSLHQLGAIADSLVHYLDMYGWLVHLLFLAFACWVCISAIRKKPILPWLTLCSLLMFIGGIFLLMREGIYYSVSLMIPLVLLATLPTLKLRLPQPGYSEPATAFAILLMLGAILNQGLLVYRYAGFAEEPYETLPINHKGFSSAFGYMEKQQDIMKLANQCDIKPDSQHVALDDVTYHALHYSYQPLFFSNSTWICCYSGAKDPGANGSPWFSTKSYLKLLRSYDSDGVIAQCNLFPDSLRALSTEGNGFCCIPKATIFNSER